MARYKARGIVVRSELGGVGNESDHGHSASGYRGGLCVGGHLEGLFTWEI